jgi:hypothetical protein
LSIALKAAGRFGNRNIAVTVRCSQLSAISSQLVHSDTNSCAIGEARSRQNAPPLRIFEPFEPLRLFLRTNLEGSKGSENLEGAGTLDEQ